MDQLDLPRTLAFLADTLGWAWQGLDAPTSRETVLDFVLWVGALQAVFYLLAFLVKGGSRF